MIDHITVGVAQITPLQWPVAFRNQQVADSTPAGLQLFYEARVLEFI